MASFMYFMPLCLSSFFSLVKTLNFENNWRYYKFSYEYLLWLYFMKYEVYFASQFYNYHLDFFFNSWLNLVFGKGFVSPALPQHLHPARLS